MTQDAGARGDMSAERKGKADRAQPREPVVLRATVMFDNAAPISVGLMDISSGGARIKLEEFDPPPTGAIVNIEVESIRFRGMGTVIRTYDTPTGIEVAIKFDSLQTQIPGKLLQFKLKSYSGRGGGIKRL